MNSPGAPELAPTGAFDLGLSVGALVLLAHAIATHGRWFAAIWLLLTGAIGLCAHSILRDGSRTVRFSGGWLDFADVPWIVIPYWSVSIYLGAVLAKGLVERTAWRGAVAPFVAAHGILCGMVALPIETVAAAAGYWTMRDAPRDSLGSVLAGTIGLSVAGLTFGLAYRLVSRTTRDDRRKFAILLVTLPGVVAVVLVVMRLTADLLSRGVPG